MWVLIDRKAVEVVSVCVCVCVRDRKAVEVVCVCVCVAVCVCVCVCMWRAAVGEVGDEGVSSHGVTLTTLM